MKKLRTIIISRTDSIGDVVLTLPMAGVLKKMFPGVRILFLGRAYTKEVVACSEHVDAFLNWDEIEKMPEVAQKVVALKQPAADVIIHVFPQAEIALLAKKAKIPLRIGTFGRFFHLTTCNKKVLFSRKKSSLHEAQLNLKLLKPLGFNKVPNLDYLTDNLGFTKIPSADKSFQKLLAKDKINLILHPKSKGSGREWGLANFEALIELLPEEKYQLFISGTEEEGELFRAHLPLNRKNVTDISGSMDLRTFIAFIARSNGLIAAGTGPLHIAAALRKFALGIFPPIRPVHPGRWAPIGENATYLVREEPCNDCRNGGTCHCMMEITPHQVKSKIEEYFSNRKKIKTD